MSWRTVVISNRAKLDLKMDYMVVRQEFNTNIHLSEISVLIIESTAVSMTAYLLNELVKRKIKVIFCDEKRNPHSELLSYYGSHDTSLKVKRQIGWKKTQKDLVWTEIVAEKIRQQKRLLQFNNFKEARLLQSYIEEIQLGDATNREGHAAKVYFNALFGMDFTRSLEHPINSALNYGYSIFLSIFNREVTSNGYITQLGIFHDNMFNPFNLSSDLMEPFRILVDEVVFDMKPDCFQKDEKERLIDILNHEVNIDGKRNYVGNAVKIYCKSVFEAIEENDTSIIKFYRNEL